ncbi:MAG TPA: FKBP-type peptidyl-prolyl cis-trans isomerase [Trebonia sp.]|jgi:peptidylprolyl isomerase|nr:FKBP-type peptidyl-prolyl cis-trans isomerase [Trebonia sp.]
MRRAHALLVVPLLAVAAIAGCGSSSPSSGSSSSSSAAAGASSSVSVTGAFGAAPKVTIPSKKAGTALYTKTLIKGTGPTLTSAESFVGNYVAYVWSGTTHKLATSTFSSHSPSLFTGSLLPGLSTAIKGATEGSRVLAVIPPKQGFGASGNSQLGITGSDTLVFVVDLVKEFGNTAGANGTHVSNGGGALPTVSTPAAGKSPTITIPKGKNAPKNLTVTTLIKGSGAKVAKGQTVVVQYTGVIWRTGKVFDSSWSRSAPFGFVLGGTPEQVIPGWDKGLLGQTVGSRVMLTIPPSDGYGKSGQSQAGIKGTDTLVFVVDILGAVNA